MQIIIHDNNNGFVVDIVDAVRKNGQYIFRSIDVLPMMEFIGEVMLDTKIAVRER